MPPLSRYYTRTRDGEVLMGYSDIYEGRQALNDLPRGAELVRAEDGVVVSVQWASDPLRARAPHWGQRGH